MHFPLIRMTCVAIFLIGSSAKALDLYLPSSAELIDKETRQGVISLPTGRFGLVNQPMQPKAGDIIRQAWRFDTTTSATDLAAGLLEHYEAQGFEVSWQCASDGCGGFDFRYGIETSPPPEFQVNLREFYYADLRKDGQIVTLLLSNVDDVTYLQQTTIVPVKSQDQGNFTELTVNSSGSGSTGRLILSGVSFDSGATSPSKVDADQMKAIADRLDANPSETVYIVGHSDQTGGISANLSVTKGRANSVRELLIKDYAVAPSRIFSEGVAFLAPIADNATPEGRARNRRVEAVFLVN